MTMLNLKTPKINSLSLFLIFSSMTPTRMIVYISKSILKGFQKISERSTIKKSDLWERTISTTPQNQI